MMRTVYIVGLVLLVVFGFACKKTPENNTQEAKKIVRRTPAPPPKELIGYVSLKNPQELIDHGIAMVKQIIPLPLDRTMLVNQILMRANLPSQLIDALDLSGTFWFLGFDDALMQEQNSTVIAIPLRAKAPFLSALNTSVNESGKDGELTVYKFKDDPTTEPIKLKIDEKYVYAATSGKAFQRGKEFLETTLLPSKPKHHVEVQLLLAQVLGSSEGKAKALIDRVTTQVDQQLQAEDPTGKQPRLADQPFVKAIKTAEQISFGIDLLAQEIAFHAVIDGKKGSEWHRHLSSYTTGPFFAQESLPAASLGAVGGYNMPLAKAWAGTLVRSLSGKGLASLYIADVQDEAAAHKQVEQLFAFLNPFLKQASPTKKAAKPLTYNTIAIHQRALDWKEGVLVSEILGKRLDTAWGIHRGKLMMAIGPSSVAELKHWIDAIESGSRSDALNTHAFFQQHLARTEHSFVGYLSLSDLIHEVMALNVPATKGEEKLPTHTDEKPKTREYLMAQGVPNVERTQLAMSLRIPLSEILAVKQLVQQMAAMSAQGSPLPFPK